MAVSLRPAAVAFDAVAPNFDARFEGCLSVAAQRRAVRAALLRVFPTHGYVLEVGGGTGIDATFLAERGFKVLLTDASPAMVSLANVKLAALGSSTEVVAGEDLDDFASRYLAQGGPQLDGAFSNFAPLNCVVDLAPVARGLAQLLKPNAAAMLVLFGTCCPVEMLLETFSGRQRQALRRFKRGAAPARLAKREFEIVYHRRKEIERVFAPWFTLEKRIGIGVTVPPSAAEPGISAHPSLLKWMERADRLLARPMAVFGDHVLYQFRRRDY
ncbi:class I SAM-dependent methyltransferase [Granulicella sp. 5B5]|uniref:class I SAM-dependent methyltransferase n=1 Tax=Granulicella sp. 5B5 TaxID=1617967 RepID=UPI0015F3669E|nr:class I SAM-dependent methyltransferase [Granulicella sp. 5B5]